MTYKDGYDKIITKYANYATNINNQYDRMKAEIEDKEITDEYTEEMKQDELSINESNRNEALEDNEDAKKAELDKYDADYRSNMDNIQNAKSTIDYDYINTTIENLDFEAPEPLVADGIDDVEKYMDKMPYTVNNTKYIYLTADNKYKAISQLEEEEYNKYSAEYDAIESKYNGYIIDINNEYNSLKTVIENKPITDEYTSEMKQQELTQNESNRQKALEDNESAKTTELDEFDEMYIDIMAPIAAALTEIKNRHETGFSGDVHINGKLHVDTDLNIEGKLNNIAIEDLLQKNDLDSVLVNKANKEHTHYIGDIIGYSPDSSGNYDDTDLRNLIKTKPTIYSYNTMDDMIADWNNIPDNSIAVSSQGADQWSATFTYKYNANRALNFTIPKDTKDYLWTRFIGSNNTPWTNPSKWRKIPVLREDETLRINMTIDRNTFITPVVIYHPNLINNDVIAFKIGKADSILKSGYFGYIYSDTDPKMTIGFHGVNHVLTIGTTTIDTALPIIASNIKADNETRLKALESRTYEPYDDTELRELINTKANNQHTHNIEDIKGYVPNEYDDTELKQMIIAKADIEHEHVLSDILDYEPYDDTEIKNLIKTKSTIYNYSTLDEVKNNWSVIDNHSFIITHDGPDQYTNTLIVRGENEHRCLILGMPKIERDYMFVKFLGNDTTPWKQESPWRKIPVLTKDEALKINMTGNRSEWNKPLEMYHSKMVDGDKNILKIGKDASNLKCADIGYIHSDTDPKITLGFHGNDYLMTIGTTTIDSPLPIKASNVKEDNETRLKAAETKLDEHKNKMDIIESNIIGLGEKTLELDDTDHEIKNDIENLDERMTERLDTIENRILDEVNTQHIYKVSSFTMPENEIIELNPDLLSSKKSNVIRNGNILTFQAYMVEKKVPTVYIGTADGTEHHDLGHAWINPKITDIIIASTSEIECYYIKAGTLDLDKIRVYPIDTSKEYHLYIDYQTVYGYYVYYDAGVITLAETGLKNNPNIPSRDSIITFGAMVDLLYPVGSIYTSMNYRNPGEFIGGTWEQIKDRFLYCVDFASLFVGGSKQITIANMPAHRHQFNDTFYRPGDMKGYPDGWDDTNSAGGYWRYGEKEEYQYDQTAQAGYGEDYMPEYMTVFAWYRTA